MIEYILIAVVGCGPVVWLWISEIGITVFPMQMVGVMTFGFRWEGGEDYELVCSPVDG